jgi:hypothetical protein
MWCGCWFLETCSFQLYNGKMCMGTSRWGSQWTCWWLWLSFMRETLSVKDFRKLLVVCWAIWRARWKALHEDIFQSLLSTFGFLSKSLNDMEPLLEKWPFVPGLNPHLYWFLNWYMLSYTNGEGVFVPGEIPNTNVKICIGWCLAAIQMWMHHQLFRPPLPRLWSVSFFSFFFSLLISSISTQIQHHHTDSTSHLYKYISYNITFIQIYLIQLNHMKNYLLTITRFTTQNSHLSHNSHKNNTITRIYSQDSRLLLARRLCPHRATAMPATPRISCTRAATAAEP